MSHAEIELNLNKAIRSRKQHWHTSHRYFYNKLIDQPPLLNLLKQSLFVEFTCGTDRLFYSIFIFNIVLHNFSEVRVKTNFSAACQNLLELKIIFYLKPLDQKESIGSKSSIIKLQFCLSNIHRFQVCFISVFSPNITMLCQIYKLKCCLFYEMGLHKSTLFKMKRQL